jgi:uncharacterized membrane protein
VFWLSHHAPEQVSRCYRFGQTFVCARCLGVYPVLVAAVLFQGVLKAPLHTEADVWLGLALAAPATADWAYGQFRPQAFSNLWRTFTGILLGVSLGRSLFIHFQAPFPALLQAQLSLVTAVAVPVILVAYLRSRRR